MHFPEHSSCSIYLPGATNPDPAQWAGCPQNALAKQRTDFPHGVVEASSGVGRDLSLLDHTAVFIDDSDREFRTSDVNRSDHELSLGELTRISLAFKRFIKTN
jgi:hypothetical protein